MKPYIANITGKHPVLTMFLFTTVFVSAFTVFGAFTQSRNVPVCVFCCVLLFCFRSLPYPVPHGGE